MKGAGFGSRDWHLGFELGVCVQGFGESIVSRLHLPRVH